MLKVIKSLSCLILLQSALYAQKTDVGFKHILNKDKSLRKVLKQTQKYGIQIIYTQIDEKEGENPRFKSFYYNCKPDQYFYPASAVKFPAVLLAFEKLNELQINDLNENSIMEVHSEITGYPDAFSDSSSANGKASVEHYAKKIFLVSDNDAFNRLYDFIGQEEFNEKLHQKGYSGTRINHRLSISLSEKANASSPEVKFYSSEIQDLIYKKEKSENQTGKYFSSSPLPIGKAFYQNGNLIEKPMDFYSKNCFTLGDQQQMLKALFYPESVAKNQRFNITDVQREKIKNLMKMLPQESDFPHYDSNEFYDSFVKFFVFGDSKAAIPDEIKIYNKVGEAYGFLSDNALIEDRKNNIRFLLSAVVYVNSNQTLNDDTYDYEQVGFPFLAQLGRVILKYEQKRATKNY